MNTSIRSLCGTGLLVVGLAACGGGGVGVGGGGIGGTGVAPAGTVRFAVTDAPACGFDAVHVTIQKVRIHKDASALDTGAGWSEVVVSPAKRVNLLSLTNGALEELGQTSLPTGKYTQLRLILGANDSTTPLANSVVPTGGSETALTTPSGQESGAKINVDIDVAADKVADFVLDFDACKSVVKRGMSGGHNLKPVIQVIPRLSDAGMRLVGYVDPSIASTATTVSVQLDGLPVKSTPPDATGKFVLYPVPAGTYDLVVTSPGHATAVMTGVPVITAAVTTVNPLSAPIVLPASSSHTASGNVTTAGSAAIPDATVRATQTSASTKFEVFARAVDASTGAYTASLPAAALLKTAYVAGATSLSFVADSTAAGKYTLEALVPSKATQTAAINLSANDAVTSFVFTLP